MRVPRMFRSHRLLTVSLFTAAVGALSAHAAIPSTHSAVPAGHPASAPANNPARLSHGRFKDFRVYAPTAKPTSFAMLLSGDQGWTTLEDNMARQLTRQGAM